jgi:Type II secretion system (T2SS), protein E, N-terminal domain
VNKKNLGEMLVASNLIDEVQMEIALAEQQRTGKKFGSTLVDLKFVDENVLAAFLSKQIDIPCISLMNIDIPKKVLRRLPSRLARDCGAIPIRIDGSRLEVAMIDPTDIDLIHGLEIGTGMTVIPLIAPQSSIEKMIEQFYPDDEKDEDTQVSRPHEVASGASDPIFMDLIEEIENADLDHRLKGIERSIGEVWTLLEKILRLLEAREIGSGRFSSDE